MEESTGISKNVPKKSTRLGRMMGFRQYTVSPWCEPKSLHPACTKFSDFVPILDTSIVTIPKFTISADIVLFGEEKLKWDKATFIKLCPQIVEGSGVLAILKMFQKRVPGWAEWWAFGSTRCKPKSLQPACTKFSNFVPILDTSTFTTPSFISSGY